MICPHCQTGFNAPAERKGLGSDADYSLVYVIRTCTECRRYIIVLETTNPLTAERKSMQVYPKGSGRRPCPTDVLREAPAIEKDYQEACLVLPDSAQASAALSRRCLQHLLEERAGVKEGDNLYDQIQHVLDGKQLPSYLSENLDALRTIGNFAAHPKRSAASGEIIPVEPGEAEWCLDVLEGLFDHYFVGPAREKAKRAAIEQKRAATKK